MSRPHHNQEGKHKEGKKAPRASAGNGHKPQARNSPARPVASHISIPSLLTLIRNTASFLFDQLPVKQSEEAPEEERQIFVELAQDPYGFIHILRRCESLPPEWWEPSASRATEIYVGYFCACLAAHHTTVATFVPTDVDNQIRGTLWQNAPGPEARTLMRTVAHAALQWDTSCLSQRVNEHSGVGPVSGHNGEQLGVLAGALGVSLMHHELEAASELDQLIRDELSREAREFDFVCMQPGMEIQVAQLAASLTHNYGDLNQGVNFWAGLPLEEPYRERFDRNGSDSDSTYAWQPSFRRALSVYNAIMSAEGHRHYPLRAVTALRRGKELLLPLSPFLDSWGERVAQSKLLSDEEKGEVLAALLLGCRKISGQIGYYRAIAGLAEGLGGDLNRLTNYMPHSARSILKDGATRQLISIRRASFESSIKKQVRNILDAKC